MEKLLYWLEKALYLALGFGTVIIFLIIFKAWANEKSDFFFFVGDLESGVIVLAVSIAIGFVLEKLLRWEIREIFAPKRKVR